MAAVANAKHEAVVQAYVADRERIGWRAYTAVYPKSSQRAAETGFSRLLKNAEFAARVKELDEKAADDGAVMSAREVLKELSNIGRADMADFVRAFALGDPVAAVDALSPDQTAALGEVTVEQFMTSGAGDTAREIRRIKFKLIAKTPALELLGRHYGLLAADPNKVSEDHVPLSERLKAYAREDAIKESEGKVVELKKGRKRHG